MDYARFNYVAQPEDSVKNFYPRVGTYDIWYKNDLVCHSLKKEEVGEALHKWLCISKEESND